MVDDIARQRFWSENNRKPDPKPGRVRSGGSRTRSRSLRANVEATHVLLVRKNGQRNWLVVANQSGRAIRDVAGSEAFCTSEMEMRRKHWPDDEFKVMAYPDALREIRHKTWSVKDGDHIPNGERVMLAATPAQLHPDMITAGVAFGLPSTGAYSRTGTVRHRDRRTGTYMVRIDGSTLSVSVEREDLVWPIPANVVPLERRK